MLFYVITSADIEKPEDLKGKVVGITNFGSATDFAIRYALKHWNMNPAKDVSIIQLNDMPSTLAAMKSGVVHAGILSSPTNLKAVDQGFKELAFLGDLGLGLEYQQVGVITTRRQIEKDPDLMQRFVQAYTEGVHRSRRTSPLH